MAKYSEITNPDLKKRLQSKYTAEIAGLSALGFRHLAYSLEALGPFSRIYLLPMAVLMSRTGEILAYPPPLRLAVANVLLGHSDPPTISLCMGLGIKLYTGFIDRTILISSTFSSERVPGPSSPIIKLAASSTVEGAWTVHREKITQMESNGYIIQPDVTFENYVRLSNQEEDLRQYG